MTAQRVLPALRGAVRMAGAVRLLLVCATLAAPSPPAHGAAANPPPAGGVLRYDGVYQSQEVEWSTSPSGGDSTRVWTYLRFTPDGLVVHFVTVTGDPERLGAFSAGNSMLPYGTVTVHDGRLSFSVFDVGTGFDPVVVDYEGYVDGDRLYLRSHSHYNGRRAEPVFAFIPMPPARLREWDGLPAAEVRGSPHAPRTPDGASSRGLDPPAAGRIGQQVQR